MCIHRERGRQGGREREEGTETNPASFKISTTASTLTQYTTDNVVYFFIFVRYIIFVR